MYGMSSTNYQTAVSIIGQQYIFADQLLDSLKTKTQPLVDLMDPLDIFTGY